MSFCKFLTGGLVYNNNTTDFTVRPCCYYHGKDTIDIAIPIQPQVDKLRSKWNDDQRDKTCRVCIEAEAQGEYSYRQSAADVIDGDGGVEFLEVMVNKQCNLACPMCSSNSSSLWYKESVKFNWPITNEQHQFHSDTKDGLIDDLFMESVKTLDASKIKYVKFCGGEPLLTDVHIRVLDMIPDPSKVTVQYTSNFTIMPKNFDQLANFKLVKWSASIDGTGKRFDLLRWPAKWSKLEKFVQKAIATAPGNTMFILEHTINPLNVFYYDEIQTWSAENFATNRFGDRSDLNIHRAIGQDKLALNFTPPALRKAVKEKYGAEHAISIMLDQYPYNNRVDDMIAYLDKLDAARSTNWRNAFPEFLSFCKSP